MKDIYFCLLKSLFLYSNNSEIVQEIFEFINSKEITKKYFNDFQSEINLSECNYINNLVQTSLFQIYKNFHTTKWVYIHLNKFSSYLVDSKDVVIKLIKDLEGTIESYKLTPDAGKSKVIVDLSYNISLKLMKNIQFNENTFHEFIKVSNLFSGLFNTEFNQDLIIALINILFSAAENVN